MLDRRKFIGRALAAAAGGLLVPKLIAAAEPKMVTPESYAVWCALQGLPIRGVPEGVRNCALALGEIVNAGVMRMPADPAWVVTSAAPWGDFLTEFRAHWKHFANTRLRVYGVGNADGRVRHLFHIPAEIWPEWSAIRDPSHDRNLPPGRYITRLDVSRRGEEHLDRREFAADAIQIASLCRGGHLPKEELAGARFDLMMVQPIRGGGP